jgi:hypothetical protein
MTTERVSVRRHDDGLYWVTRAGRLFGVYQSRIEANKRRDEVLLPENENWYAS